MPLQESVMCFVRLHRIMSFAKQSNFSEEATQTLSDTHRSHLPFLHFFISSSLSHPVPSAAQPHPHLDTLKLFPLSQGSKRQWDMAIHRTQSNLVLYGQELRKTYSAIYNLALLIS